MDGRWPMADGRFKQRGLGGLILFFTLIFAAHLLAADVAADFSSANELYAKGKFADAATAYEKILQTGASSPALLLNAGNAEFKAGHLGRAIAAYRRADGVIAVSKGCADDVHKTYKVPLGQIITIPNPIRIEEILDDGPAAVVHLGHVRRRIEAGDGVRRQTPVHGRLR